MRKLLSFGFVFGLIIIMLSGCSMRSDCPSRSIQTIKRVERCDRYISIPAWYGNYCDNCDSCNNCSCY